MIKKNTLGLYEHFDYSGRVLTTINSRLRTVQGSLTYSVPCTALTESGETCAPLLRITQLNARNSIHRSRIYMCVENNLYYRLY